jgi:hypothetical protein
MIATLLTVMCAVALLGLVVNKADGFPGRGDTLSQELNAFAYDPSSDYRTGTCFLEGMAPGNEASLDQCLKAQPGKRNVLLWGDSHAAHLYRGLERALPTEATLTQLTSSTCTPSIAPPPTGDVACRAVNERALQGIRDGLYNEVVIAARWNTIDAGDLAGTLADLSSIPRATITVVGPDPEWDPSLPRNWSMFQVGSMTELPQYSAEGLDQDQFDLNASLRSVVEASGSDYFDVLGVLCRDDACLVRVGATTDSLTAWDYGHFTAMGSDLVGAALEKALVARPGN